MSSVWLNWFQNGERLIRFINCCGVVLNNDCIFVSWCRDSWMFGMMITMNNMKITFESSTSQNILASIWRHFNIFSKFLPFRFKINSQSICVHLYQHSSCPRSSIPTYMSLREWWFIIQSDRHGLLVYNLQLSHITSKLLMYNLQLAMFRLSSIFFK